MLGLRLQFAHGFTTLRGSGPSGDDADGGREEVTCGRFGGFISNGDKIHTVPNSPL